MARPRKPSKKAPGADPGEPKGLGPPPDSLDEAGRSCWLSVAAVLEDSPSNKAADRLLVELLCESWSRWKLAQATIALPADQGGGLVIRAANGFLQKSPYLEIASASQKECRLILFQLGLSPKSRGEAKDVGAGSPENDPLLRFLAGGDVKAPKKRA